MPRLEFQNVRKTFRDAGGSTVEAVSGLSFSIADGEFLVLAGPSGCGKTTVLRLIAGLESPDGGSIRFGGRDAGGVAPEKRDVAMVFQDHALFPHLTVRENLALGLRLRRIPRETVDRQVAAAAESLGMTPLLNRLPETLSGGERQRVALGRALARQPKVLLLDEPLSNLDPPLRAQVREQILHCHEERQMTIVYVTHDQSEALPLHCRLALLREGALQQIGTPLELYEQPRNLFVASFLGHPAIQPIQGTLQLLAGRRVLAASASPEIQFPAPDFAQIDWPAWNGRPVIAAIRPEDLVVQRAAETDSDRHPGILERIDFSPAGFVLTLRMGTGTRLVSRQPVAPDLSPGTSAGFRADPSKIHWFDPVTGRRLPP